MAHPALMTGHGTCMYSLVPVCVVHQQSWLTNSSWRLAHSLDNVLFRDTLHCSLMTDGGGYAYFLCCYRFIAPYVCTAQYLVKQMLYSSFILIYFIVNSYIVNKTLKSTGAQPPEIEHHRMETEGLRKRRPGVSITDTRLRFLHQENL